MITEDNNVWDNKKTKVSEKEPLLKSRPVSAYSAVDIKRILSVWPWVILFGVLGFMGGKFYLRYVDTIYLVTASINIEQKQEVTIGQALFSTTRDPFNDQIAYFKSPSLAIQLVDSLGLQYTESAKGRFKDKDLYGSIIWHIVSDTADNETPSVSFTVMPKAKSFHYSYGSSSEGEAKWGEPFSVNGHKVIVEKLREVSETPILFKSTDKLTAAFALVRGITVMPSKESNIIHVSYSDISSDRAIDILNGLIKLYNHVLKQDKSQSFSQAIDFIEARIGPLGRELDSIETELAHYKSSKGFIGTSANGTIYLGKMQTIDKQLEDINVLKSTIAAVESYINNPNIKDENLSFNGITDTYLQSSVMQYAQLRQDRDKLAMIVTENDANLQMLDKHIAEVRNNMGVQLQNYKRNLLIAENSYQQNSNSVNALLRNTPSEEKELLDKFRIQNIKESLFLTLLQKREEAGIAKASVTVDTKVLTPPVKLTAPVKPSPSQILVASFLIGLLIPIIWAIVKELSNNKIISKKQLQSMTAIPVLAELEETEVEKNDLFVIESNKRSMFGEQIRSLRTNLNFYQTGDKPSSFILITSSMSGEGKSFISLNLARSYSLQGKKVALLEFDLRRPKMSKLMGVPKENAGMSSLLIGKSEPAEILYNPIEGTPSEHLHFYPAGAIAPNPQELISGIYMKKFRTYLEENYDIVIIDTPPYGIVADAQILGQWADVSLIITRFNQTMKDQVQEINEWKEAGIFKSMALVFNGIKSKGYYGYKNGNYYYKRKYGYGYYSSDTGDKK